MPLKLNWKTHLFSRSCVDLNRTRGSNGDSEIVVAVGFRGSQLALGRVDSKGGYDCKTKSNNGRRSLPPENCVAEVTKPRIKPDVVHWKVKVRRSSVLIYVRTYWVE